MKKIYIKFFSALILVLSFNAIYAQLAISSFSPQSGPVGTSVTIMGAGFSTTPSNNIVFFDNVRATVNSATASQLTVTVPNGTTSYAEISISLGSSLRTSSAFNGTGYFHVVYSGGQMTTNNYYNQSLNIYGNADAVASGDMNGDGKADIVVLQNNTTTDSIKVYLSNGGFGFTLAFGTSIGNLSGSTALSLADIDNDGDLDAAVSINQGASDLLFFKNNGAGGLGLPQNLTVGYITSLTAEDINGDGYVDFVATCSTPYLYNLKNNSGSSFTPIQITAGHTSSVTGDFNNDGKIDIAATISANNQYELLLGNGTGGFTSQGLSTVSFSCEKIVKGDFNADGKLDIAFSGHTAGLIGVCLGLGNGTFQTATNYPASNASDLNVADFDGDGKLDLQSMVNGGSNGFYLFKGNGDGTFTTPIIVPGSMPTTTYNSATVSDFNNDGRPDIATGNSSAGLMNIQYFKIPLNISLLSSTNTTCFGGNDGSATTNTTGGFTPYSYSWTGGATVANPTNLTAGSHTVTVTDAVGETAQTIVTINSPSQVIATITGSTNVSCYGGNNGTATASASGGTAGYVYNWAPLGGTGSTGTAMQAGTSTVTVTDANGCVATATVSISQPSALSTAILSQTNVSCFGGSNGSASVTVTGGVTPYTYNWTPVGGTSSAATGLAAGSYTCSITDNNGCVIPQIVTITEPPNLSSSISSQTNVSCNGLNNASATVLPTGGTPSYTYSWTPVGGLGSTASGLAAGNYTCNITDVNGCVYAQLVSITQPAILNASITGSTNVTCFGFNDGTAGANGSGGTSPYTYSWSNGGTASTVTGLPPATYTCTVTDNNACTSTVTVSITQPTVLSATPTTTSITCNGGSNGNITVTPSGGVPSYTYSWNPNVSSGSSATNLTAGNYTITVTDMNGCNTVIMPSVVEPSAITASINILSNVSCNTGADGSLKATASGGTGTITYNWNPGGATTNQISGLTAGTYTCTYTDINGCTTNKSATITEPTALVVTAASSTDVLCYNNAEGQASINSPTGGTPSYVIDWLPGTPNGDGTVDVTSLTAGSYTCMVTDANGCKDSALFTINQPPALTIGVGSVTNVSCNGGNDGNGSVIVGGGTTSYSYNWSPSGGTAATATNLVAGSYTCNVTDANGCTINKNITISEPSAISPNLFTQTNVNCNGMATGTASVTVTGGTPAYSFNWTPSGGTGSSASGLSAGNYTCTITDANLCAATQTVTITEPAAITSGITSTDALCNGSMDGTATTNVTGGTAGYNYAWAPTGGSSAAASGLGHGTYTVTITDANSCVLIDSVIINEPTSLVNNMSGTDVTCNGAMDGTAVDNVTGGTPPYTFSWSPSAQNTQTAIGIGPGNYTCTVTDANGCTTFDFSTINEPTQLTASASETSGAGCVGQSNGVADVSVSGGTPSYTLSWSSGGTATTETGLIAGTYTCTVTDNNLCTTTATVTITETASTDVTGSLTFSGGTISSGYVYAFKQQPSVNGIDTVDIAPIVAGTPATYTFSGLAADNYLIKAILDTSANPNAVPTYYGNTFQWDSSTVVIHGCAQNDTADIDIIAIDTTTGTGTVSGFIIEGQGFQGLRLNNGNNPNIPFVPGGPLKGIDVKLGKNPSGGIQARTSSDSTGYYQFSNIPDGDYKIYVDIPNLPMDSTREVTISTGNPASTQNNYVADSLVIYIDTAQVNAIHASIKEYDNKFSIYPNPTSNLMTLNFILNNAVQSCKVQITNSMGALVYNNTQRSIAKGEHNIALNSVEIGLKAGVYFVNLVLDNRVYTQRIVVME